MTDGVGTFNGNNLMHMSSIARLRDAGDPRMIDRIDALRLIGKYNLYNEEDRHLMVRVTTHPEKTFDGEVVNFVANTRDEIVNVGGPGWVEMLDGGGVRVYLQADFFVDVKFVVSDEAPEGWFEVEITSRYYNPRLIRIGANFLIGLTRPDEGWLDTLTEEELQTKPFI